MTTLYRFYDEHGVLLYVGITDNRERRFVEHAKAKPWWHHVATTTTEEHELREDAEWLERIAIHEESPIYNVTEHAPVPPLSYWNAADPQAWTVVAAVEEHTSTTVTVESDVFGRLRLRWPAIPAEAAVTLTLDQARKRAKARRRHEIEARGGNVVEMPGVAETRWRLRDALAAYDARQRTRNVRRETADRQ